MNKIEKMAELYIQMKDLAEKPITPQNVVAVSAEAMNIADRSLFGDDLYAVVSGQLSNHFGLKSEEALPILKEFGIEFASLFNGRPEYFAPGSQSLELFKSAFFNYIRKGSMTVLALAEQFVLTTGGNVATAKRLIQADIKAGRLPAQKIGNMYLINDLDASEWLLNPKRGSRSNE